VEEAPRGRRASRGSRGRSGRLTSPRVLIAVAVASLGGGSECPTPGDSKDALDAIVRIEEHDMEWDVDEHRSTREEPRRVAAPVDVHLRANACLGPLAVPASSVSPVPTRIKLGFSDPLVPGELASGASVEFGEIEDYLFLLTVGAGCNSTPGPAPTIWAEDPPRVGVPFTWKGAGLLPGTGVILVISPFPIPGGLDLVALGVPIPPGTCFLNVTPFLVLAGGLVGPSGFRSTTLSIPPDPTLAGGTVSIQEFQIAIAPALSILATPSLPVTILP
jgi:hypothetical protein